MSNQNLKVEMFKADAIITVDFSLPFFHRIQQMLLSYTTTHKPEELKECVEKIKQGNQILLPWEEHFETLIILINTIEEKARKDGLLEINEVPVV
jgi:hypothetical protein